MSEIATPAGDSANVNLDVERLADGVIVKEFPGADEREVLTALEEVTRT